MQILGFLTSLLVEVRAHIPNDNSSGSRPPHSDYGTPLIRMIAAFLVIAAFLSAALWLAVRLVMELQ
jgi:hypothetical protein